MNAYQTVPAVGADEGSLLARASRRSSALVLGSPFWGWAGPVLIMIFGGFLRFYRLSQPKAVVFDETYYVPDANSILRHGVELQHLSSVNKLLVQGNPNIFVQSTTASTCAPHRPPCLLGEVVAHPALGKMMMAVGSVDVRPDAFRLAILGRADRHGLDPAAGPDHAADDAVDDARLRSRAPARPRRS